MAESVFSSIALKEVMRRQGVTNNFCEMARVLGMKVVLVPNDKPVRTGEFEIK